MSKIHTNLENNLELVSVHYAKSGGTSLWAELKRHYGDAIIADNSHDPCNINQRYNPPFRLSAETRAVMGHIRPDLYRVGKNTKIITFLRDPVDRTLSAYFFWLTLAPGASLEHDAFLANRPSIFEYAEESPGASIEAYFGGFDMERFDFIGFHEERVEHLVCLSNFMGFEISSEIKLNTTPFSPERAAIQSDDRAMSRLREILKVEVEFYNDLRSKWLPKLKQLETMPEHKREFYKVAATDPQRRLEGRESDLEATPGARGECRDKIEFANSLQAGDQEQRAAATQSPEERTVLTAIGEQEQSIEHLYKLLDHTTFRNSELLKQKGALSLALEERAGELEAASTALDERNVQLLRANDEIATLRVSVTSLEAQLQKAIAESAALQREIASLEARQVELDEQRSRAQQEIQLLESRLRQRDEEISQTSLELNAARLELKEVSDKVEDLASANARLGAERDSQAEEIEALESLARSLENDKAAIEAKLTESEHWVFKLAGTRADYEKEMAKLSRRLADEEELRKKEGANHSRVVRELERLRARLAEVEQVLSSELAAAAVERAEESQRHAGELSALNATLAELSKRHAAELAERFDEIATITRILREAERKHSTGDGSSDVVKDIALVLQGLPRWWALLPKSLRDKRKFARLRRRGLFDSERYLQIYPDVAAERMDPLEHYLRHGMAEGRTSAID